MAIDKNFTPLEADCRATANRNECRHNLTHMGFNAPHELLTGFTITKTIKGNPPRLPFMHIKNKVLGEKYHLSLVFAGKAVMKKLNQKYRKKDYLPNVLSFPLSKT